MGLWGSGIRETNIRLRFYLFSFAGVIAFASILYWRSQLMYSQEYVEFPKHEIKVTKKSPLKGPGQSDQLRKELDNDQN